MNPNEKRYLVIFKSLVTFLAVMILVRQGVESFAFYQKTNPLIIKTDGPFPGTPIVSLQPPQSCSGYSCQTRIWENKVPHIHPFARNMTPLSAESGWKEEKSWPYRYMRFDGQDDVVEIPNSTFGTSSGFTASVWVRAAAKDKGIGQVFDARSGSFLSPLRITQRLDGFLCEMESPDGNRVFRTPLRSMPVTVGKWQHLLCTFNSDSGRLSAFLNGVAASEVVVTLGQNIQSNSLSLGGSLTASTGENFAGDIAAFKLEPFPSAAIRAESIYLESCDPAERKHGIRVSSLAGQRGN